MFTDVELKINSVCPPSPGSDEQGQRLVSTAAPTTTTVAQTTDPATGLTVFQECMKQCEIPSEYKPVCGTDLTTYFNIDRLNCAKRCTQGIFSLFFYINTTCALGTLKSREFNKHDIINCHI